MKKMKIKDFKGGWFIGNFEPTLLKTPDFEVCYHVHKKGEKWDKHCHLQATEYNVVLRGKIKFDQGIVRKGDVFVFEKGEWANPEFLTDCEVLVVKVPSVPNDKVMWKDES